MNDIFSNILNVCIVIYLNNISIYYQHVKEVLKWPHKVSFYAKVEKCKFYSKSVEYTKYILTSSWLTMLDKKVKIIQDWPKPKKVKIIQFFLGFANFYHWTIFNYLDIVISLVTIASSCLQHDLSMIYRVEGLFFIMQQLAAL